MKKLDRIGFYGILTEPKIGYLPLARIMVEQGVRIIQLRMKDAPRETIRDTAFALRSEIPASTIFIINDDPALALEVQADGVHLGQSDMPYAEARAMLGPDAIIGLSTHNPRQTEEACALNPDYIGVGPVYATPTKKIPDPVLGISGMREMLALSTVPAVCLGGIDHDNVDDVIAGGAQNICAVRCINAADKPDVELDKMISKMFN
ncbi:MAG: thiamine phosphate synthase [Deltaproteobacteria bacterium]|nr:thiamine phosphate synthase [Deltaproteobacteria bacterium]MBN2670919.1 thiamine phosphate synthase [Deltaproteobacteria bacterium]